MFLTRRKRLTQGKLGGTERKVGGEKKKIRLKTKEIVRDDPLRQEHSREQHGVTQKKNGARRIKIGSEGTRDTEKYVMIYQRPSNVGDWEVEVVCGVRGGFRER